MTSCDSCSERPDTPARASATSDWAGRCRILQEFLLLHDVSAMLAQGLELRDAVQPLFKKLSEATALRRGLLMIVNRESSELMVEEMQEKPHADHHDKTLREKLAEGVLGRVATIGEAIVLTNLAEVEDDEWSALEKRLFAEARAQGESLIAVPIRQGSEVLGTLSFTRAAASEQALTIDVRFLVLVAGQVGLAVRFRQMAKERIDTLREENERLQQQIARSFVPEGMVGRSAAMQNVHFHIDQVADSKTTVLIRGETGSGKERIAHAIWTGSGRRKKPFVRVNCAALPESIIESELFGHEKGAFTGALALRKGRFELADTGTIFLDEIGEVSAATQAKLLRVLQEGTFERVGGTQTIRVDVRVVTATNRNLEKMIEEGKFRLDLYYRINVFPIYVPPLRDRRSDILALADHFLEKYAKQNGKNVARISTPAIDMLMAYHWPGNVRELENTIERAVLLSQDGVIHGFHLPPTLQTGEASGTTPRGTLEDAVCAVEREMLAEALKTHRGIMAKAARQLGLTERIMGLRVKKYGIDPERFKADPAAAALEAKRPTP
ncbi:MAG: sigma 54-interacting transcriptional regulator [Opitutaceae bacterium]|nr:sigma 54-interacting transcriptional regulator [Opitutaceae bacterium]